MRRVEVLSDENEEDDDDDGFPQEGHTRAASMPRLNAEHYVRPLCAACPVSWPPYCLHRFRGLPPGSTGSISAHERKKWYSLSLSLFLNI